MLAHPVHVPRWFRRGWPSRCRGRSPWGGRCSTARGSPARPRVGGHAASREVNTSCARSPATSPQRVRGARGATVASAASCLAIEAGIGPYPSRIAGPSLAPRTTSRSMITPSWTFAAGPVGRPERVQVPGLAALDRRRPRCPSPAACQPVRAAPRSRVRRPSSRSVPSLSWSSSSAVTSAGLRSSWVGSNESVPSLVIPSPRRCASPVLAHRVNTAIRRSPIGIHSSPLSSRRGLGRGLRCSPTPRSR